MKYDFDLITIGAGSGGVRASRIAAKHGARVAIIENSALGGICVNLGCIPKKLFVYASQYHETAKEAAGYGWKFDNAQFDWHTLRENKNKEIKRLNQIYEKLLLDAGVKIILGTAIFVDPHTLDVDGERYTAEKILIATGSAPFVPEIPGHEQAITSDQAFHLQSLPKKITVVGGGYIALEFATIFNGLGVETTLMHRGSALLNGFDQSIREFAGEELKKKGIQLILNQKIEKVNLSTDELVLFATGRRANIDALKLERISLNLHDNKSIKVNEFYQTSIPHIYAVGDVIGGPQLTPLAIKQGHLVADNLFAGQSRTLNHLLIPTAVFCEPNIATVGLSETDARAQFGDVTIYECTFRALKHTMTNSAEKTLMKLVVDKKTDKVLGAHMVGEHAGEIIQGFAVAMQMGATKKDFDNTLAIHPTIAEEFVLMR
jgi:glutathione reductase (NADPH)